MAEGIQYTSKKDTRVLLCVGLHVFVHVFVHFWRLSRAVWSSCQPITVLALQREVAVVEFSFTSETVFLPIPTAEHTGKKHSAFSVQARRQGGCVGCVRTRPVCREVHLEHSCCVTQRFDACGACVSRLL